MLKSFFSKIFFIGFFCFITINISYADTSNISKIAIITEPQTIKPNEVSKEITIQIQDSFGNKVVALETIRFDAFQSSSPTGIFVSCTTPTNFPTDYIAKNNSNKNICYKDSTEGTYTITVKTTNTITPLTATQIIIISSQTSSSASTIDGTSTSTQSSSETSTSNYQSNLSNYSSVYLTDLSGSIDFKVDAGRERTASINSPINFRSRAINSKGDEIYGGDFTWTFGDGSYAYGREVNHTYEYPGEYIVVVNARYGNNTAVSRTKVKVVEANVVISDVSKDGKSLTLSNKTKSEINLYNWRIMANTKDFKFPIDTIIKANSKLVIPTSVLNFYGEKLDRITLFCPNGEFASGYNLSLPIILSASSSNLEVVRQAKEMLTQLDKLQAKLNNIKEHPVSFNEKTEKVADKSTAGAEVEIDLGKDTANLADINPGILTRVINYPKNLLNFFISIFEK
ncbi:PKD domain-containing protein [Candidatus Nomurabacteria bacterium]|nr:PKD domain-containing protein [Candidatus Nomurabacteria bacterium]